MNQVVVDHRDPSMMLIWRRYDPYGKANLGIAVDIERTLHLGVARGDDAVIIEELASIDPPRVREVLADWRQQKWGRRIPIDEIEAVSWSNSSGSVTFGLRDGAEKWHLRTPHEAQLMGQEVAAYVVPSASALSRRQLQPASDEVRRPMLCLVAFLSGIAILLHGRTWTNYGPYLRDWYRSTQDIASAERPLPDHLLPNLFERVSPLWTLLIAVVLLALVWVVLQVAGRPTVVTSRRRPPPSRDEVTRERARLALRSR